MTTLSKSEIRALQDVQATIGSIREEFARKRKQRSKARPSAYTQEDH